MSRLDKLATNLVQDPEGVWVTPSRSSVSYPENLRNTLALIEDSSFWFQHRNACILQLVSVFPPPGLLIDVGGGNGYVSRALQNAGWPVALVEPGADGVRHAMQRGVSQIIRAAFEDIAFLPAVIPAAGLFDVLEHIENDRGFLEGLLTHMVPGGRVYLTVPALQWLWCAEDDAAGHMRRYTVSNLAHVCCAAGYEVEYATSFFNYLPLFSLLYRALPYRLHLNRMARDPSHYTRDHTVRNPMLEWLLNSFHERELSAIRSGQVSRFGGSCLAVIRKRC